MPYLFVRFPADIIIWLPYSDLTADGLANANVNNESDRRIPSPHVVMAHTRFALETFEGGASTRIPETLRADVTEWPALSLCKVERKMSVKNGTLHSSTITSKRLQHSYPLLGEAVNVDCWGPEIVNLSSPSMAWLFRTSSAALRSTSVSL